MKIKLIQKDLSVVFEGEAEMLLSMKSKDKNLKKLLDKLYHNEIDYILYLEQETGKTFIIKKIN